MRILLSVLLLVLLTSPVSGQRVQIGDMLYEDGSLIAVDASGHYGGLAWMCMEDGLNVVLVLGSMMYGDADNDIRVAHRFDRQPGKAGYWRMYQPKMAFNRMSRVRTFTRNAKAARGVTVIAEDPADGERRVFQFSMMGLTRGLKRLSCAR